MKLPRSLLTKASIIPGMLCYIFAKAAYNEYQIFIPPTILCSFHSLRLLESTVGLSRRNTPTDVGAEVQRRCRAGSSTLIYCARETTSGLFYIIPVDCSSNSVLSNLR